MKQRSTVEQIDAALESWKLLPPESARIQSQYQMALELSAISQCIKLGILDDKGNPTPRTSELCEQIRKGI